MGKISERESFLADQSCPHLDYPNFTVPTYLLSSDLL